MIYFPGAFSQGLICHQPDATLAVSQQSVDEELDGEKAEERDVREKLDCWSCGSQVCGWLKKTGGAE